MHRTKTRRSLFAAVAGLVAVLAAATATPVGAEETIGPDRPTLAPTRPPADFAVPWKNGPWDVGLHTYEITDPARADRTLVIDLWYPVDPDDAATAEPAALDLLVTEMELPIALDDPDPSGAAEFPLFVFSHGSGGFRAQSWFLMEAVASHGYVVAAPDHTGNTATGPSDPGEVIAFNRPRDISFVIDEVLERDGDPTDKFAGLVDEDRIAVGGHSFGGFTTLAVAGGFDDYQADTRVDAIVPIAPASSLLSDEELASISVPVMFLSGTDDITVPLDPGTTRPWDLISSGRAWRVDLQDGGHNSFTNVCDLLEVLLEAGLDEALLAFLIASAEEGCAPELIDIDDAHWLVRNYTVAFLKSTIGGPRSWYPLMLTDWFADHFRLQVDLFSASDR